jgi:hypothetical protein
VRVKVAQQLFPRHFCGRSVLRWDRKEGSALVARSPSGYALQQSPDVQPTSPWPHNPGS